MATIVILGALGEKMARFGPRRSESAMAILVGTGIGGGFVQDSKLWRGARESASEIGHTVMQIGGPKCGCGNLGCFEALASRTAIERDIRQAIEAGPRLADKRTDRRRSGSYSQRSLA